MASETLIFQLSDIHFGVEDRHALAWVLKEIRDQQPAAIIISGDITMRATHREYAAAQQWIGSLGPPVFVEVGNHDLPYYNLIERMVAPYRRFERLKQAVESPLNLPDLEVVNLLSTPRVQPRWPWSDGIVKEAELEKTLARIDALPANSNVLVVAHHPLEERGRNGELLTIGGDKALAELAKRDIVAVISGHVHDGFDLMHETPHGAVRMIGCGTLSKRLRSTPPSFNELRWNGVELSVRARNYVGLDTAEMQVEAVPEGKLPGE